MRRCVALTFTPPCEQRDRRARLGAPRHREVSGQTCLPTRSAKCPTPSFLPDRIEVTRPIPAPPSAIFDILRSPAGHVAIDASGMLQDYTGEPAEKVGDTFVIHMDRESLNDFPLGKYDVTVHIIAFERDKEIAWNLGPDIGSLTSTATASSRARTASPTSRPTTTGRRSPATSRNASRSCRSRPCVRRSASSNERCATACSAYVPVT